MLICGMLFYLFAAFLLLSAVMVVSSRNTVYSALWLVVSFFNAAGLFMLLKAEFISMMMIIVYVGAVMVLFVFIVMTVDLEAHSSNNKFSGYKVICAIIAFSMCVDLYLVFSTSLSKSSILMADTAIKIPDGDEVSNTKVIGLVLYTDYLLPFIIAGFILFTAMIGTIVVTVRHKILVKRQDISKQISRRRSDSVELVKVEFNKGIK